MPSCGPPPTAALRPQRSYWPGLSTRHASDPAHSTLGNHRNPPSALSLTRVLCIWQEKTTTASSGLHLLIRVDFLITSLKLLQWLHTRGCSEGQVHIWLALSLVPSCFHFDTFLLCSYYFCYGRVSYQKKWHLPRLCHTRLYWDPPFVRSVDKVPNLYASLCYRAQSCRCTASRKLAGHHRCSLPCPLHAVLFQVPR